MSQRSFASAEYAMKKKRTRREVFLAEIDLFLPAHATSNASPVHCDDRYC
jgi:hypothetical protein